MDDFPKATPPPSTTPVEPKTPAAPAKELTPEEKQLLACKKVISKLTVKSYYGCVNIDQPLFPSVLKKIEDSGFEVAYSDFYATGDGHSVKVTITDPGLRQANVTEVNRRATDFMAGSGASQDLQEGLSTLMNAFLGTSAPPMSGHNTTTFRF